MLRLLGSSALLLAIVASACGGSANQPPDVGGVAEIATESPPTATPTRTSTPAPTSTPTPTATPIPPTPTPEPVLDDGLGHRWLWGAWRNPDDSIWYPPPPVTGQSSGTITHGGPNESLVIEIAQALVGANWRAAVRVAWCESGFNPGATGAAGERGFWQIHPQHSDSTYDPWGNGQAMVRISSGGTNWGQWAGGRGWDWAAGAACSESKPGWPG